MNFTTGAQMALNQKAISQNRFQFAFRNAFAQQSRSMRNGARLVHDHPPRARASSSPLGG